MGVFRAVNNSYTCNIVTTRKLIYFKSLIVDYTVHYESITRKYIEVKCKGSVSLLQTIKLNLGKPLLSRHCKLIAYIVFQI
jgi:hypothetical protein